MDVPLSVGSQDTNRWCDSPHPVRLRLGFSDGSSREADLSGELHGPVFEPLADPEFFGRSFWTSSLARSYGLTARTSIRLCCTATSSQHRFAAAEGADPSPAYALLPARQRDGFVVPRISTAMTFGGGVAGIGFDGRGFGEEGVSLISNPRV